MSAMGSEGKCRLLAKNPSRLSGRFRDCASTPLMTVYGQTFIWPKSGVTYSLIVSVNRP